MPLHDYECKTCGAVREDVYHRVADPAPACPICGGEAKALIGRFHSPFMRSIHAYADPNKEGSHIDGFWAYRRQSSISGQPEPIYIDSMETLRSFNRAEGLAAPGDVPTNCTISPDGRRLVSDGMPGQWARGGAFPSIPSRLQEILDKPEEEFKTPPATCTPCMPADYGIRAQAVDALPEMAG